MNTHMTRAKARLEARKKAEELVSKMTLEERASQLRYDAPAIPRLNIPAYNWWNEGLHGVARAGVATMFPQAIAMAATFDPDMLETMGDCVAIEGRAKYNEAARIGDRDIYKGMTFWSPNINIFRDPRWGRGHETYGEDPYLTSLLGLSFVKGLQGEDGELKAAACAKHMAVHSGPEALRHEFNAEVSEKDLEETYLPAFEALVREGDVEAVMGCYNRVNGEPGCGSETLIKKILRGKWGFSGHFVSDCWAIADFHLHHMVTATPQESAALAVNNGCDLNCGVTYLHMLTAYEQGLVSEETINEAAVRVYTTRYLLGIMDGSRYDDVPYTVVESPEHLAQSVRAAEEGIVLLQNKDNILPLDLNKLKTIGVIGPNANSRAALIGNYHGTSSEYITVLEGIQRYVGDSARILYSEGCNLFKSKTEDLALEGDRLSEAQTVAEHSDVVILVVGLDESLEGEEGDSGNSYASGDKSDLLLPKPQRDLCERIAATGKPVILINMTGSAMDLSFAKENFDGILQLWYPGARGGIAAARVLFGEVSPSGKLPVTFYNKIEDLPEFTDYRMKGRTYRYITDKPQYPFGFGLTYGDVCVTGAAVRSVSVHKVSDMEDGDGHIAGLAADGTFRSAEIEVTVKNKGKVPTDDVVQIYVHARKSANATPNPILAGVKRVHLDAGETVAVQIYLRDPAFTVVNDEGQRIHESASYDVYAGTSQPDELSRELTGKAPVSVTVSF